MWKLIRSEVAIFLGALVACVFARSPATQFKVTMEWKSLNFTWPSAELLQSAVSQGLYLPENVIISGVNYFDDHFYVTLPRMKNGVPATLARIPVEGSTAPSLSPFPTWQLNNLGDCNALQNTQNVEIDDNGLIWILDGGRTATLTKNPVNKCPPKLMIYDIKNEKINTVFTFPEDVASRNASFLYDLVIDDGYAYITDNSGRDPGLIVFSLKQNRSWKIRHAKSMRADPAAQEFRVNGVGISATINIAGIALGSQIHSDNQSLTIDEDREVFYCPISSYHIYSIRTSILRNESSANGGKEFQGPVRDLGVKASQTDGMIMDNEGTLYYGLLGSSSISQWDSHTPFASGQKVISRDATYIQWPNSFTFDLSGNLIVLTNSLHKFIYGKMNLNETNFRLLTSHTGTKSYLSTSTPLDYEHHNMTRKPTPNNDDNDDNDDDDHDDASNSTSHTTNLQDSASLGNTTTMSTREMDATNTTTAHTSDISTPKPEPSSEPTPEPSAEPTTEPTPRSRPGPHTDLDTKTRTETSSTPSATESTATTSVATTETKLTGKTDGTTTSITPKDHHGKPLLHASSSDHSKLGFTVIILSVLLAHLFK